MITEEERAELVRYRLQRAGETLDEAEILLKAGKLPGAVNRIYYSVFYAAGALLLKHGLSSVKHAGLISLFHKEIVNKGVLEKEFGRILERAFANRTEGDYKDRRVFETEQVESLFLEGKRFIEKIKISCL
jgi:Uncharacterized conserved protein related to C-terminal domain of eukaryotic chaperone, SACSIN